MKRAVSSGDGARTVNPHDHASPVSWWVAHAQPESRAGFMAEAKTRTIAREHTANVRDAKRARIGLAAQWPMRGVIQKPLGVKP